MFNNLCATIFFHAYFLPIICSYNFSCHNHCGPGRRDDGGDGGGDGGRCDLVVGRWYERAVTTRTARCRDEETRFTAAAGDARYAGRGLRTRVAGSDRWPVDGLAVRFSARRRPGRRAARAKTPKLRRRRPAIRLTPVGSRTT